MVYKPRSQLIRNAFLLTVILECFEGICFMCEYIYVNLNVVMDSTFY